MLREMFQEFYKIEGYLIHKLDFFAIQVSYLELSI